MCLKLHNFVNLFEFLALNAQKDSTLYIYLNDLVIGTVLFEISVKSKLKNCSVHKFLEILLILFGFLMLTFL